MDKMDRRTDDGLYISVNAGKKWTKWTEGFPTVPVKDLIIQPREHDLVIGTFGRAAWVLDDIRPLRAIAKKQTVLHKKMELFTPPTAYQASYQQPSGSRFGADAMFNAKNRSYGALIQYYINLPEREKQKEKTEKKEDTTTKIKWDSIQFDFYDKDRLIRTLKRKVPKENGIHTINWRMNEKGVAHASRKISKQKSEPSGVIVKPGVYRIKATFGDVVSEQSITVKYDPRLNISEEAINQKYNAAKELEQYQKTMTDAVKQLVESKEIATNFKKKLTKEDKEKYKNQIKSSENTIKKIDSLLTIYLGKDDKRQGIIRSINPNVNTRLQTARRYVNSRFGNQTATEKRLIQQFKTSLDKALKETNSFFLDGWSTYKSEIETIKISPFKETERFFINN